MSIPFHCVKCKIPTAGLFVCPTCNQVPVNIAAEDTRIMGEWIKKLMNESQDAKPQKSEFVNFLDKAKKVDTPPFSTPPFGGHFGTPNPFFSFNLSPSSSNLHDFGTSNNPFPSPSSSNSNGFRTFFSN